MVAALAHLSALADHLAALIESGIPLIDSLRLIAETSSLWYQESLREAADNLARGMLLGASLEKHPIHYPRYFTLIIRIGEQHGVLVKVLRDLATSLQALHERMVSLRALLVAPCASLGGALGLGWFFFAHVQPALTEIWEMPGGSSTTTLPDAAPLLENTLSSSDLIMGACALTALLILIANHFRKKKNMHSLSLARLSATWQSFRSYSFFLLLATLVRAGTPLIQALTGIAHGAPGKQTYKEIERVIEALKNGEFLTKALEDKSTLLITPSLKALISRGEQSGNVPGALTHAAKIAEYMLKKRLDTLERTVPVVILILAITIIGAMLWSVYNSLFASMEVGMAHMNVL